MKLTQIVSEYWAEMQIKDSLSRPPPLVMRNASARLIFVAPINPFYAVTPVSKIYPNYSILDLGDISPQSYLHLIGIWSRDANSYFL